MQIPKLTIAVVLLLIAGQLAFSSELLFPKPENIAQLGFSPKTPLNIVFYNFIHADYSHLVFNLAAIIAAGLVIEAVLRKRDFLALFFAGSAFAGFLFALINPAFAVIGSSGGAVALLAAAFTVDTKKTVLYTAGFMALALGIVLAGNYYVEYTNEKIAAEIAGLEQERQQALQQNNTGLAQQTEQQIGTRQARALQIRRGIETKNITAPNFEIHVFAALFGVFYAALFARKELYRNTREIFGFGRKAIGRNK